MASCIKIINAFLKWFSQEYGKGNNEDNGNGGNGNGDEPIEFGVCKDTDILSFWKKYNVIWACDQSKFGMEDEWFHYPLDIADWLEIVYDCLDNCPPYTSNTQTKAGFDCDDFADAFPVWAKMFYGCNAAWEVWGDTPEGGHAWNAVMCGKNEMYEIEPQNGEVWVFGSNPSYRAIIAK